MLLLTLRPFLVKLWSKNVLKSTIFFTKTRFTNFSSKISFSPINQKIAIDVAAVASGSAPGTLFGTCPVSQPNPPTSPTSWPCGTQLPHPPRAFHVIALRWGNKYKWTNAIDMDGREFAGQPLHRNKSGARCQIAMGFNLVKMPTLA